MTVKLALCYLEPAFYIGARTSLLKKSDSELRHKPLRLNILFCLARWMASFQITNSLHSSDFDHVKFQLRAHLLKAHYARTAQRILNSSSLRSVVDSMGQLIDTPGLPIRSY